MRTVLLDIETTDLKADFGRIICAVLKEYGTRRDERIFVPKDYRNDADVLLHLRNRLEDFDICVGHYIKGFDIPFINTRLLMKNERRLKKMFAVDTFYIAKNKLRTLSRKSLKNLGDTLQTDEEKMSVSRLVWNNARDGDKSAIKIIVDRCVSDVLLTEQVYTKFLKSGLIDTLVKF